METSRTGITALQEDIVDQRRRRAHTQTRVTSSGSLPGQTCLAVSEEAGEGAILGRGVVDLHAPREDSPDNTT